MYGCAKRESNMTVCRMTGEDERRPVSPGQLQSTSHGTFSGNTDGQRSLGAQGQSPNTGRNSVTVHSKVNKQPDEIEALAAMCDYIKFWIPSKQFNNSMPYSQLWCIFSNRHLFLFEQGRENWIRQASSGMAGFSSHVPTSSN